MIANPSEQQAEVIAAVASGGSDDLAVQARAGSGKTTTILHAVAERPPGTRAFLCAFNKTVADELKARTGGDRGIKARTLHAIGMRAVSREYGESVEVDDRREYLIAEQVCGEQEQEAMLATVAKLAKVAKECAPDNATSLDAINVVGANLGLIPDDDEFPGWPADKILRAASEVVQRSANVDADRRVSYADMLYVPLVKRLRPEQSDLIVVDEAQDMNLAQLRLAARMRRRGGRFVVVGDDRQAIYSWRGAAPGALDRVRTSLNARLLKLTVTFRCAASIVAEARKIVPDIEAAPGARDGIVRWDAWSSILDAAPGDFVIGRTNAVLVTACLDLIRARRRATIRGAGLGDALIGLVRRLAKGADDVAALMVRVEQWREREVAKATARGAKDGAQAATDQADCLAVISEECHTISEVIERIRDLFVEDGRGHIICTTVHRAKGLEARRVYYLAGSFEGRDQSDLEEANIRYVAVTRAQEELVKVVDDKPQETR